MALEAPRRPVVRSTGGVTRMTRCALQSDYAASQGEGSAQTSGRQLVISRALGLVAGGARF